MLRVLHVDSERGWRGGQVQLAALLDPGVDGLVAANDRLRAGFPGPSWGWSAVDLMAAIRAFRPDCVAAHSSAAHGLAVLQRWVPVIVHRRVDFRPRWTSRPKYRAAKGFVAVSDAVRAVLVESGVCPRRIRVVWDGVDPACTLVPVVRASRVLAVGALVPHKGHGTLIDAAALGGFGVDIAGEGPLRSALEARIRATGADVRLLGAVDDVPDRLARAVAFVHPSHEEGLGQAVLEARAAGCPVVATRAGGLPESAGPYALLVPPRDAVALARAVALIRRSARPEATLAPAFTVAAMRAGTRAAHVALLDGI